ncbi:MAG TPA: 2-keto-4-pentenoate hydratase [Acidimicrobiales bacterium]|nr:2-keto-4-pentenoate hydratase [Acidimicrobiales bacterium]
MEPSERQEAADALFAAERQVSPIAPLTDRWPAMTAADAYAVQRLNVERRLAGGRRVRGHKVGLSSPVMQQMMGVDQPDYGHLLDDMFVFEGTAVDTATLCTPRVEVEVGFVLAGPIVGPGAHAGDVLRATAFVVPAIEIIDSRIVDWKIRLADTIADNASSAKLVLGGRATRIEDVDLRRLGGVLSVNGEVVDSGAAGAVLGNPVTSVAWLANVLAGFGVALEAGDVVLPGSFTRAVDVAPGDVVEARFDHLGDVSVRFR